MRRFIFLSTLLVFADASHGLAQGTTGDSAAVRAPTADLRPANDSLFRRARRLVGEGNGVAGRVLMDSLLKAADPATPAYGDVLYWHGVVALTAAEAERDYRRVIVEYPLAYYKDDALLAIAELEQARGDRAGALQHLQRYVHDHAPSKERGIAALGAARLAFEQRDAQTACAMISEARASAGSGDVELRNQIDAYAGRCAGQQLSASTVPAAPLPAVSVSPPTPSPRASAPVATASPARPATRSTTSGKIARDESPASGSAKGTSLDTLSTTALGKEAPPNEVSRKEPPSPKPAPPVAPVPAPAAARAENATGTTGTWTVQLAAYETRLPAEQLVAKLATRGVKARVSGMTRPFRVRLGFYASYREAADVVASLRKRGIVGFATEETRVPATTPP